MSNFQIMLETATFYFQNKITNKYIKVFLEENGILTLLLHVYIQKLNYNFISRKQPLHANALHHRSHYFYKCKLHHVCWKTLDLFLTSFFAMLDLL